MGNGETSVASRTFRAAAFEGTGREGRTRDEGDGGDAARVSGFALVIYR